MDRPFLPLQNEREDGVPPFSHHAGPSPFSLREGVLEALFGGQLDSMGRNPTEVPLKAPMKWLVSPFCGGFFWAEKQGGFPSPGNPLPLLCNTSPFFLHVRNKEKPTPTPSKGAATIRSR